MTENDGSPRHLTLTLDEAINEAKRLGITQNQFILYRLKAENANFDWTIDELKEEAIRKGVSLDTLLMNDMMDFDAMTEEAESRGLTLEQFRRLVQTEREIKQHKTSQSQKTMDELRCEAADLGVPAGEYIRQFRQQEAQNVLNQASLGEIDLGVVTKEAEKPPGTSNKSTRNKVLAFVFWAFFNGIVDTLLKLALRVQFLGALPVMVIAVVGYFLAKLLYRKLELNSLRKEIRSTKPTVTTTNTFPDSKPVGKIQEEAEHLGLNPTEYAQYLAHKNANNTSNQRFPQPSPSKQKPPPSSRSAFWKGFFLGVFVVLFLGLLSMQLNLVNISLETPVPTGGPSSAPKAVSTLPKSVETSVVATPTHTKEWVASWEEEYSFAPELVGYVTKHADNPHTYLSYYDKIWGDLTREEGDIIFATLYPSQRKLVHFPTLKAGGNIFYTVVGGSYHSISSCYTLLASDAIQLAYLEDAAKLQLVPCSKCVSDEYYYRK